MTTITFLVCLMYLWCSHHSWSVSYLLCFTTAYLLSYTFNNLLTHLLRHTVIILSVISRLCHMWHHVHLSVPAGLRSAPVAHPWHALMPCCGRFQCAVWPFVALLQYEAWSGISVATIYDSSPYRDCRPACPPPPHTTATDIIASAPMLHTLLNAALSCATKRAYRRAISSYANFCRFHFPVVPVFPASPCVLGAFYCTSSLSTLGASYFHDLCVCHIIRS